MIKNLRGTQAPESNSEDAPLQTKVNRESFVSLVYGVGGIIGGYANGLQTNNTLVRQLEVVEKPNYLSHSMILGFIAAIILGSLLEYKLKKDFSIRCCFAIALTGGLCFPVILKGVKDTAALPFKNYQLEQEIIVEQQNNIENNKVIATVTTDPKVKKRAIEQIAKVSERISNPEAGIKAIGDIAKDTENTEIKNKAVDRLNSIVDNADNSNAVSVEADATIETIFNNNIDELAAIEHINDLAGTAISAENESDRKLAIERMTVYYAHFNQSLDLYIAGTLDRLHKLGKNNYYLVDEKNILYGL